MSNDHRIFDYAARTRNQARATDAHNFLFQEMASRLSERLDDINRSFSSVLSLGFPAAHEKLVVTQSHTLDEREHLSFEPNIFDAIISCGALHWVNDLPGVLAQMKNILKPDGLLLAIFPGGQTLHELRTAITESSMTHEGGLAPRVSPFIDVRDAGALLQRAGFALPVVDSDTLTVRYEHALKLMHDLRFMGEANALLARPKHFTRRATLFAAAEIYQRLAGDDARIPATFELITLTAWKPHASQQQPAARGSGKLNLGDALR